MFLLYEQGTLNGRASTRFMSSSQINTRPNLSINIHFAKSGLVIRELDMNLELTLLNKNVLPSHFYVVKMGKQAGKTFLNWNMLA